MRKVWGQDRRSCYLVLGVKRVKFIPVNFFGEHAHDPDNASHQTQAVLSLTNGYSGKHVRMALTGKKWPYHD